MPGKTGREWQREDEKIKPSPEGTTVSTQTLPVKYVIRIDENNNIHADPQEPGLSKFKGKDMKTVLQNCNDAISSGRILVKDGTYLFKSGNGIEIDGDITVEAENRWGGCFQVRGQYNQ